MLLPGANSARILVADDDADLLALVEFSLRHAGFEVVSARDGLAALAAFDSGRFSLLVLDINMPGADGFTVCATVRTRSSLPIVMLTARDQEADMVRALEAGADAYLAKPFSPRTLIARLRALLRRTSESDVPEVIVGGHVLKPESHSLLANGSELHLTRLETRVLYTLMTNAGRTISADRLLMDAWGRSGPEERHALKQVIYRLRRKLADQPEAAELLNTNRNAGYRWGTEPTASDRSLPEESGPVTLP